MTLLARRTWVVLLATAVIAACGNTAEQTPTPQTVTLIVEGMT